MTDGDTGGAAGETAIGDQCTLLTQTQSLEVRGRVEHFLHARTTLGAFVGDDDDVAFLHLLAQNRFNGLFLRLNDESTANEVEERLIDTRALNDRALLGDVAVKDRKSTVLCVCVLNIADAAVLGISFQGLEKVCGRESMGRTHATGRGEVTMLGLVARAATADIPLSKPLFQGRSVDRVHIALQQTGAVELTQECGNTTCAVDMLNVVLRRVRSHLAQARNPARNRIDIIQGEVHPGLVSDRKNVKNGIGRATHRDIQAHRVLKGVLGRDGTGQNRIIIIVVVRTAHIDNAVAGFQEELLALNLRGQGGAVTGKRQANGLVQAVHGICGEHTSARSTGRAGIRFDACQLSIGHRVIDSHDHGIDQIKAVLNNAFNGSAGFHRTTRDEDRRDVQTHGGDEHTGGDLVAVRDTHQRIGAVSVDHVLDRICNHLT